MATKERIQCQLKLRLTCAQEATLRRWLWHLTGVYNWTIKTVEREHAAGRTPSAIDLKSRIVGHSQKIGMPRDPCNGTVETARDAWARCFHRQNQKPRLKGRRNPLNSIALPHGILAWRGARPWIPGIGPVRVHKQEVPAGRAGYARIVKRASGWYLCLFVQAAPAVIQRVGEGAVGIDPGFKSVLALSTGELIDHPRELEAGESRLAQAHRGCRKRLTARLQERIRNRRKNRNHHLSKRLVSENRLIAFSQDPTFGMAAKFGKSVASSGHTQLRRQLRYKSLTGGSEYIEVPSRNSTRTCSACGAITGPAGYAGLKVRRWECPECGSKHDRDVNAARNTLTAGLGMSLEYGREAVPGIAPYVTPRDPSALLDRAVLVERRVTVREGAVEPT